jgi:P4 family phage/plasmid primase-like protien
MSGRRKIKKVITADLKIADNDIMYFPGNNMEDFRDKIKDFNIKKSPEKYKTKLAVIMIEYHHYCWVGDKKGEYRKWYNGKWYSKVEMPLNSVIREYLEETVGWNEKWRDDVKARIKEWAQHERVEFDAEPRFVNFSNGMLDLTTYGFKAHSNEPDPEYLYTIQIPHDYVPGLMPTKFLGWLGERLEWDWDRIDLILKYIGYSMTLNVSYQKLMMLKDGKDVNRKGNTGKSSLLKIIKVIIGFGNYSSVALQRLAQKFGKSGIVGRILNFYADISTSKPIGDMSKIKILIDDEYDYEIKAGDLGTAKNTTKHIFSTNGMPPVVKLDLAYCRRWIIVPFNIIITKVIPDFEEHMIRDENELRSIISIAIDAYKELQEDGKFMAQSPEDVMDLIMMETDSVYRFLKECCDIDPRFSESQEDVYTEYAEFAAADGVGEILKKASFTGDLYSKGFGRGRRSSKNENGVRPYTYTGLKLKTTMFVPSKSDKNQVSLTAMYLKPEHHLDEFEDGIKGSPSLLEEACKEEIEKEIEEEESKDNISPMDLLWRTQKKKKQKPKTKGENQ